MDSTNILSSIESILKQIVEKQNEIEIKLDLSVNPEKYQ